MRETIFLGSYQ